MMDSITCRKAEPLVAPNAGPYKLSERQDGILSQASFWSSVQNFLRSQDIIVADQGTAFYGSVKLLLSHGAT
jgi:indolepyruvate decarboxylase